MAKSTEGVSVVQGQTMTDRTRSVFDLLTSEISRNLVSQANTTNLKHVDSVYVACILLTRKRLLVLTNKVDIAVEGVLLASS